MSHRCFFKRKIPHRLVSNSKSCLCKENFLFGNQFAKHDQLIPFFPNSFDLSMIYIFFATSLSLTLMCLIYSSKRSQMKSKTLERKLIVFLHSCSEFSLLSVIKWLSLSSNPSRSHKNYFKKLFLLQTSDFSFNFCH